MRAGIEDYEMLRALKGRDPAAAEQIATSAVSSFTDYVRDVATFRKIEQRSFAQNTDFIADLSNAGA